MFLPREWCLKGKAQMRESMGLGSTGQERWMFPISYQFCPKILKYKCSFLAIVIISDAWLWVQTQRFSQGEPYAILQRLRQVNSLRRLSRSRCDDTLVREMSTKQSRKIDDQPKMSIMSFPPKDGFLNPSDRYMSSVGYGFLWNLPSYGSVSITPENISWFSEASQNVDFWVTTIPATTKGMDNCLSILVQGAWGLLNEEWYL